jgi:hypothetical protein
MECMKPPAELCQTLDRKVWELRVPSAQSDEILEKYCVTAFSTIGNTARFRIVAEKQPFANAVQTAANLDDVYLYYFGGDAHDTE